MTTGGCHGGGGDVQQKKFATHPKKVNSAALKSPKGLTASAVCNRSANAKVVAHVSDDENMLKKSQRSAERGAA